MKLFDENVKKELELHGLTDKVLEVGWNYLQAHKAMKEGNNDG